MHRRASFNSRFSSSSVRLPFGFELLTKAGGTTDAVVIAVAVFALNILCVSVIAALLVVAEQSTGALGAVEDDEHESGSDTSNAAPVPASSKIACSKSSRVSNAQPELESFLAIVLRTAPTSIPSARAAQAGDADMALSILVGI